MSSNYPLQSAEDFNEYVETIREDYYDYTKWCNNTKENYKLQEEDFVLDFMSPQYMANAAPLLLTGLYNGLATGKEHQNLMPLIHDMEDLVVHNAENRFVSHASPLSLAEHHNYINREL